MNDAELQDLIDQSPAPPFNLAAVLAAEVLRLRAALIRLEHDVSYTLGTALYGLSADGLPLWGEHVAATLAVDAAREIERLRRIDHGHA